MTDEIRLSSTSLDTLARCGQQYYYRYVLGEKRPPGIALITGTATHAAASSNLQSKLVTGQLLDTAEVMEIADASIRREFDRGVKITEEDGTDEADARGKASDRAVAMAIAHAAFLAPVIQPTAVERPWQLDIQAEGIVLTGIIDVEEEGGLRDLKTSAKKPFANAAETSEQLTAYALARNTIDGVQEPVVTLDYIVATAGSEVVVQPPLVSTRGQADFDRLLRRVERAAQVVRSGAFQPAVPGTYPCTEKWCGWWGSCPFSRRPVSVATKGEP